MSQQWERTVIELRHYGQQASWDFFPFKYPKLILRFSVSLKARKGVSPGPSANVNKQ